MICANCEAMGKSAEKIFSRAERISMLSAQVALIQSIKRGRNEHNDLVVANSVVSKLLLSFDAPMRNTLIEGFQRSVGMAITLGSCPHGLQVIR